MEEIGNRANIVDSFKGSELLGKLKDEIDLETMAVNRLWELLNDESFYAMVLDYAQLVQPEHH